MTEIPDIPTAVPATATATAEVPPAPVTHTDLQALERRLVDQIAQASGIRSEDIRQVRDQLTAQRQDIRSVRAHQETQDRRTNALELELRPAVREIKESTSRIDTTLDGIKSLLERDRKTVDDHTASIQHLTQRSSDNAEKVATIDRDVGDLRTRLADVVNPLAFMVLGDKKTPSMLERLEAFNQKMETDRQEFQSSLTKLETDVKPVIESVTAWRDQLQSWRDTLKTPNGRAVVFGSFVLIIQLFSKIDLVGLVQSLGSLFTGG